MKSHEQTIEKIIMHQIDHKQMFRSNKQSINDILTFLSLHVTKVFSNIFSYLIVYMEQKSGITRRIVSVETVVVRGGLVSVELVAVDGRIISSLLT